MLMTTPKEENYEIVHIPAKLPFLPNQQPTVNVFAALIEPKHANALVRKLNQIAPLENLRHVKRVHKKRLEEGKIQLSVILCLANDDGNEPCDTPTNIIELINAYKLSAFTKKVCKYAATSKEAWEEQCKLWPTSYHPPTYNIDGITGFSAEDSQSISSFMRLAIDLAKSGDDHVVNAAVIVDPSIKQVIASARDQTCSWPSTTKNIRMESTCPVKLENSSPFVGNRIKSHVTNPDREATKPSTTLTKCQNTDLNGLSDETTHLNAGVSCLFPWQWAKQKSQASTHFWHPLRHAAIVAIECSSVRDRCLYPGSGPMVESSFDMDHIQSSSADPLAKRLKTTFPNDDKETNAQANGMKSETDRPYLCTGYDIYLVWEPCIMCAMALVHQRIRRIFYAFPNPNAGALGSVQRLQGERSLNHHYAVFRVLLPEEALHRRIT